MRNDIDKFHTREGDFIKIPISGLSNYEINSYGDIKNLNSGKIRPSGNLSTNRKGYKRVSLVTDDKVKKCFYIHRLLATTFIYNPSPEKFSEVDHINRNRNRNRRDNSITNLRWADRSLNSRNRSNFNKLSSIVYHRLSDEGDILETLIGKDIKKSTRDFLNRSIKIGTRFKGFYWKKSNLEVDNLLEKLGKEPKDLVTSPTIFEKIKVTEEGLVELSGNLTLGSLDSSGYRFITVLRKNIPVHRLMASVYLGLSLDNRSLVVDHIDGDRQNNNLRNLRVVTMSENNNNPVTKEKITKPVQKFSPDLYKVRKTYSSVVDAAMDNNLSSSDISRCCKGYTRQVGGFHWKYVDDKFKKVVQDSSLNIARICPSTKSIVDVFIRLSDIVPSSESRRYSSLKRSVKSGKVFEGYVYKKYDHVRSHE